MLPADLIYADDYTADGKSSHDYPAIYRKGSLKVDLPVNSSTYQPRQASWPLSSLRHAMLVYHIAPELHAAERHKL